MSDRARLCECFYDGVECVLLHAVQEFDIGGGEPVQMHTVLLDGLSLGWTPAVSYPGTLEEALARLLVEIDPETWQEVSP